MPSTGGRLLSIGEFSRLSRISIRMLRHYDERGVLHPTETDPSSGYRFYSAGLLGTAHRVCELRDVGLGVAELAACVPLLDDPRAMRAVLDEQRLRLEADAASVADRIRRVVHLRENLETPAMTIEIIERDIPARIVASVRDTIPTYQSEGLLWDRLMSNLHAAGAVVAHAPLAVAVFHDEDYVETNPDVEVQLDVVAPFTSTDGVRCVEVPALHLVQGTVLGSYDGITQASEALGRWIAERGLRTVGPMQNIYVVSPSENPDPASWVTEVCLPVASA